ncbi:head-tail connector protein [Streptomyces sp. NPDC088785]|uniref:head-tail connector protein n=1 Tax=Streptomyces sp. NPDC088785 TaxID=3365897 RepID=UPI00380F2ADF
MALLTLDEAKAQLDIESDVDDVELEVYIDGLTAPIENLVGVVEERTVTETVQGTGATLVLLKTPAIALVSITPQVTGGSLLDVAQLHLDGATGVVRPLTGGCFYGGPWTVTYTAGRAEIPPTIRLAARMLLQHLWRTRYGSARGQSGADDWSVSEPVPGFGYAIPNRVLQLLEAYKLPPGVA